MLLRLPLSSPTLEEGNEVHRYDRDTWAVSIGVVTKVAEDDIHVDFGDDCLSFGTLDIFYAIDTLSGDEQWVTVKRGDMIANYRNS